MSFLTLDGVVVPVTPNGAQEGAIERIGSESRAYAGNLRSTVREEKRSWTFTTRSLSSSEESDIRAAIADGAFITMSGDILGGASLLVSAALNGAPSTKVKGGFRNVLTLTVREV